MSAVSNGLRPGPSTPLSIIFVILLYGMRRNYFFGDSKGLQSSKKRGMNSLSHGPGGTRTTPFGILILSYPPQRSQNFHVATEDSATKRIHEIPCTTFYWRRSRPTEFPTKVWYGIVTIFQCGTKVRKYDFGRVNGLPLSLLDYSYLLVVHPVPGRATILVPVLYFLLLRSVPVGPSVAYRTSLSKSQCTCTAVPGTAVYTCYTPTCTRRFVLAYIWYRPYCTWKWLQVGRMSYVGPTSARTLGPAGPRSY